MSKKGGKDGGGQMDKEKELGKLYKELGALRPTEDFDPEQEDWEKAVKVCNKILNLDSNDVTAFHCKVVALMQAGRFAETLKQMDASKHQLDLDFEVAYCHYRLNDPRKALAVLDGVANPQVKHSDLKAQVLYRLEEFEQCYGVYKDLIKSTDDKYDTERMTNLSAVTANMADKSKMVVDCKDTFEQRYNAGCNHAAVGELGKAETALKKAEEVAKKFLQEEGEEDIEEETGIIRVQLGYVMQRLGREKEAATVYNQVLKSKPSDIGLVAVASNNLLCLNRDQNIFDSKKRLKAATVEGLELKLTSSQRRQIARNSALLAMFTAQVDLCKQLVAELEPAPADGPLILASALARAGRHQEAVASLLGGGNKSPEPLTLLTAAQILLAAGEVKKATETLSQLPPNWKFRTGPLSTLVTLHLAQDQRQATALLLKEAVEWNKSSGVEGAGMATVWRKTAEFHLKTGEAKVAAESLEELQRLEPSLTTLAQLVTAYAKCDLGKALAASKKLPPFQPPQDLDVDSLEAASWAGKTFKAAGKTPKPGEKTPKKTKDDEGLLVKKKTIKKRKKKLPKNYNPNVDPDPERWLPKKERTGLKYMPGGYRKPRKDKRKPEKFTGAQGTDVGKSETFDYSGKLAASREAAGKQASPEPQAPASGPRAQQKVQKNANKGKKKGGKKQF